MSLLLPLLAVAAHAAPCPPAPTVGESWHDRTGEVAAVAADAVAELEAYAFPGPWDEEERIGVRTDGLLIIRDGALLYERYNGEWSPDKPHLLWSASKSFTASLAGIAVAEGALSLDDSICDHVKPVNEDLCAVKVRHLLEFSSGIAWRETYEGQPPTASSVLAMLFGDGYDDMARFVTTHALRDPPGTTYQYSTGDTVLLAAVVQAAQKTDDDVAQHTLFEPLGITSAVWERDRTGTYVGGSYLYLTPRDMGRYGTFLLNDGCWNGERILPEGWVGRARQPAPSLAGNRLVEREEGDVPGWNLWLNRPMESLGEMEPPWPAAPVDLYGALGHWRQAVYVIPSENLVVVRVADDRDGESYNHGELVARAIAVARDVPRAGDNEDRGDTSPAPAEPVDHEAVEGASPDEPEAPAAPEAGAPMTPEVVALAARTGWEDFFPMPDPPEPSDAEPAAEPPEKYDLGLLKLASAYAARSMCSCHFVSRRSVEDCESYIRVSPNVAKAKVFEDEQRVRARSLGMAKVWARYTGGAEGCVLEE